MNPADDAGRETLELLADPEACTELAEADEAIIRGDVVRGVEAVRALRKTQEQAPSPPEHP